MIDNPIPENLRCDHLLLLIGTNPLPNWVSARLLLNPNGCVYLIHSPDTKDFAERLKNLLSRDGIQVERYETPEAEEAEIKSRVESLTDTLLKAGKVSIGLNYTGGTKMMSVHAHQALSNKMKESKTLPVLSYLDARTLRMKFDGGSRDGYKVALAPRAAVEFESLLSLHEDFQKENISYQTKPLAGQASAGLVNVHSYYQGQRAWWKWCEDTIRPKNPQTWRAENANLNQVTIPTKTIFESILTGQYRNLRSVILSEILKGFDEFYTGLSVQPDSTLAELAPRNGFSDSLQLADWLAGQWLEHYTFAQIEACAEDARLNPKGLALNLEVKNMGGRKFESDVLALRGYQLFYFSCYSGSDFQRAKLKLFEAVVRATQLGGDEALIALVSCIDSDKVDDLRRQVESDWAVTGRIQVYGRKDLSRLSGKLQNWFNHGGHF